LSKLIAIIDDEVEMEFLYSMLFEAAVEKKLVEFHFFSDSRVFIEWFANRKPDLLLCDINLPHISGVELSKRVKESGHPVQTYFVSGHDERDYKDVMKRLGVSRFISKPLDFNHVANLIETDLGLSLS
jgi:FixJ family two-component response regulator